MLVISNLIGYSKFFSQSKQRYFIQQISICPKVRLPFCRPKHLFWFLGLSTMEKISLSGSNGFETFELFKAFGFRASRFRARDVTFTTTTGFCVAVWSTKQLNFTCDVLFLTPFRRSEIQVEVNKFAQLIETDFCLLLLYTLSIT